MKLKIDDLTVNLETHGKGKIVIFLHGWGGNLYSLFPVARQLNYKSILIDLPGFGKSTTPNNPISSFEYAAIIEKLIENSAIDEAVLVGHSFGGKIAAIIASHNPEWLKGLVLISSPGIKLSEPLHFKFKKYIYKTLKKIISILPKNEKTLEILRNIFGSEDFKNSKGILREILKIVVNEDISNLLVKIQSKTLLIWGKRDKDVPLKVGIKFNELIKNSKLIVYENAGHFPYLENFDSFINDLNNFLSEVYQNE
jgi:pimeloyl-ACP methyl ester carboxylesterase